MMKALCSTVEYFSLWRSSPDELIAGCHFEALKARLERSLAPNDSSAGSTLLVSAIARLRVKGPGNNFSQMCPIICLLLSFGADPNPVTKAGSRLIELLLSPHSYHKELVNVAIAYGADFSCYSDTEDEVVQGIREESHSGRGRIMSLCAEAKILHSAGDFKKALGKYERACLLSQQYLDACDHDHPQNQDLGFRGAYQALFDKLTRTHEKLATELREEDTQAADFERKCK